MSQYPKRDRRAKTGSSLRRAPQLAEQRQFARQAAPLRKLAREYRRQVRTLFSKQELRRAAVLGKQAREAYHRAGIEGPRSAADLALLRQATSRKAAARLRRELPARGKWKQIRAAYLHEHHAAVADAFRPRGALIAWGVETTPLFATRAPPFSVFDSGTIATGGSSSGTYYSDGSRGGFRDESFTVPAIGHLINSLITDHETDGIFSRSYVVRCRAACGTPFTTTTAGRLQVTAELQNFYNRISLSLRDRHGFSSGEIYVSVNLFVRVIQPSRDTVLSDRILWDGYVDPGARDVDMLLPDLDTTVPYTITATTAQPLVANESVLVLAGCEVLVESELNDMCSHVNALLWWQLSRLIIGVV